MELDSGFKDRLRWAITAKETSQSGLARHLGVTPQAIQQWTSGVTSSPRRDHLQQASEFLGCRYEWLAFGRGPMTVAETKEKAAPSGASETVLLAHEWQAHMLAALPPDTHDNWQRKVGHPSGRASIHVDWLSDTLLAGIGLYKEVGNLVSSSRQHLWMLAMLNEVLPLVPGRRSLLILAPLESWRDTPERHIEALRAEARTMGVDLVHVRTPEQAAEALLCHGQVEPIQEGEDLGLDVSPLL